MYIYMTKKCMKKFIKTGFIRRFKNISFKF